jgi:CHAD domain-containing protein
MVLEYPALETFLTVVLLREKRVMRQIVRALQKVQPGKMEGDLASVAAQVRTLLSQPVVREAAHAAVVGAAGIAVLRGRERFSMIHRDDTASIHLFRVAFKKMRYTMEALRPLFPSVTEEQLKVMDNYQQKMGDIQDVEVCCALRSTPMPPGGTRRTVRLSSR